MDIGYDNEQKIQELVRKFEESHLLYLQTDDSPRKLDQRHKLEGYIEHYLCLISNEQKYIFKETSKILDISASCKEFSGYKATNGWSTISLYASNLLSQPWRKEYKNINTYSGYYQHEIVANLVGAEMMFRIMGYKDNGCGILSLRGPIDPDKVSNVSRDAIVAFVECKIMKQIWENVTNNYDISWLDILEFRKNHTGTPEQAIRALNYRNLIYSQSYLSNTQVEEYCDVNSKATSYLVPNKPYNNVHSIYRNCVQSDDPIPIKSDHPYCYDFYEVNNKFKKKYSDKLIENPSQDQPLQKNHISVVSNGVGIFRPDPLMENNSTGTRLVPHQNNLTTSNFNNNINLNVINDKQSDVVDTLNTFELEKEWNVSNTSNAECIPIKNVDNVNYASNNHINTWNCVACTFLNSESNTICQICSKSRLQNIENEPAISDGKACTHCTLINKKNVLVCEACSRPLNNVTNEF